jgi:WD40 repeat protein
MATVLFESIPFVEKDTEIQHHPAARPASLLQSLLAAARGLVGPPLPPTEACPGCVAVMPRRRDVVAVTCATQPDCRVGDIYIFCGGDWVFPPLTHPSQQAGVLCLVWMPLSDVLLVGTTTGIALWSLCSLFEKETDKSWVNILEHPLGKPIHDIQACPTGRLFAALSKGDNEILIFDSYMKTATPLRSISGPGSSCAEMAWAPSGNFILLGTQ